MIHRGFVEEVCRGTGRRVRGEDEEGGGAARVRRDEQRIREDEQYDPPDQQDLQGSHRFRRHLPQRYSGSISQSLTL